MGHFCSRRAESTAPPSRASTLRETAMQAGGRTQDAAALSAKTESPAAAATQRTPDAASSGAPDVAIAAPASAAEEAAARNQPPTIPTRQTPAAVPASAVPASTAQAPAARSPAAAASTQQESAKPRSEGSRGCAPKEPQASKAVVSRGADCLELLQDEIEHMLKQCTIEKLQKVRELKGSSVLLGKFVVQGTARLHKNVCTFQVGVTFSWEILEPFGGSLGWQGSVEIPEFTHKDTAPKIVVNGPRGVRDRERFRYAVDWMKEQGARTVAEYLDGPDLSAAVVGAASDDEEEEEEQQEPAGSAAPTLPEARPQVGDVTDWAEEWLKNRLCALSLNLFGGLIVARISSCNVSGQASRSSSEGEPRVSYQLRLDCAWSATASNGGPGGGEGSLIIPEFSPEKGFAKCEVLVEKAAGKKTSGQTVTAFRQQGVDAVRSTLEQFAHEIDSF